MVKIGNDCIKELERLLNKGKKIQLEYNHQNDSIKILEINMKKVKNNA